MSSSPQEFSKGVGQTLDAQSDFQEMASTIRRLLEEAGPCELVWSRRKFKNLICEFEVAAKNGDLAKQSTFVARTYKRGRGLENFVNLAKLWEAGFRPPSPFTVVQPIAYVPERGVLLQERAPGRLLADIVYTDPQARRKALESAAQWLGTLHTSRIDAPTRLEKLRTFVSRYGTELAEALPEHAARIELLASCALAGLEDSQLAPLAPGHGDFHSTNLLIDQMGRVTAIDLVNFCVQERAADVAYFLTQTAIMGYFRRGSFAATAWERRCFLRDYRKVAPALRHERLGLYQGISLLQSLHYERCVLHTGNTAMVEPWLNNAERSLLQRKFMLVDLGGQREAARKHQPASACSLHAMNERKPIADA